MKTICFFICIITIINISCKQQNNINKENISQKVLAWQGKKLNLPDSIFILNTQNHSEFIDKKQNNGNLKVISFINGNCHACIENLKKWESHFISQVDTSKIELLFYVNTNDFLFFKTMVYPEIEFSYPLLIDTTNAYLKDNNLKRSDKILNTFLVNQKNEVILVGNPMYNKKLMKLYKDEINNSLN